MQTDTLHPKEDCRPHCSDCQYPLDGDGDCATVGCPHGPMTLRDHAAERGYQDWKAER